jgi:hypothetical protein
VRDFGVVLHKLAVSPTGRIVIGDTQGRLHIVALDVLEPAPVVA